MVMMNIQESILSDLQNRVKVSEIIKDNVYRGKFQIWGCPLEISRRFKYNYLKWLFIVN